MAGSNIDPSFIAIVMPLPSRPEFETIAKRKSSSWSTTPFITAEKPTKVFKWKTIELAAAEEIELTKIRNMEQTSLRALYPGTHLVELKTNGIRMANVEYELR